MSLEIEPEYPNKKLRHIGKYNFLMPAKLNVRCPSDFMEFRKESIFQGIHQRFEDQVGLHSGQVALETPDVAYSYTEINGFANSIAGEILAASGNELAQVAILMPDKADVIITILASLKAHKVYVPLDPSYPKERLRMMMEDAEPVILLTDDSQLGLAEELAGNRVRIINTSQVERHVEAPNLDLPCNPTDRAYILYTSGSTGRPKGIAFLHRNLLHTTMCLTNSLFFSPSDKVTWLHSASFAASVVDIYCCLANGGALYPWDVKSQGFTGLVDWLSQKHVTTFQWIPSAFRQLLRTVPEDFIFKDIRLVVMASEPLTIREVELFRRHFPAGSHLVNQVGTSESYNYRLYPLDHHTPLEGANVPGGYPVSEEREVLILNENHVAMPAGSVGEIGIRSDYMSGGYWRDEVLTQSKFIHVGNNKTPVYLTGDLGKLEPDGCLIHLGRKDFQVKIRGYRVELAEIEHVLAQVPGIADSAAWVVKNQLGDDHLVGFLVMKNGAIFDQSTVERHLESHLPDYMVPRHYMLLDSLPALPTGKIDRKALPNPFLQTPTSGTSPAKTDESLETEIIMLFKELLQLDEVRSDSRLEQLGGDSLLAAVLMHRIYQRYHVEVDFGEVARLPTPAHIASLISHATKGRDASGSESHRPGSMETVHKSPR